jgi:Lipopolysaccharide-assembly
MKFWVSLGIVLLVSPLFFSGCYSFKGISIPDDVRTFHVEVFDNQTIDATPTYPVAITERLKDKIRTESKLLYRAEADSADIVFVGTVVEYNVSSIAPQANNQTAFNQLRITVRIEYVNKKYEKTNWKQSFPFQLQFPSTVNLLDVQDDLVKQINDQLVEDIFNKAFTDW